MRRLTYVVQFHRAPSPGASEAPTIAHSLAARTLIDVNGVTAEFCSVAGGHGTMENSYVLNDDQTLFFEWGTITLGAPANTLSFQSIGAGTMLGKLDPEQGFSLGSVVWRITGGAGFFAGATGSITSNFLIDLATNELIDNQLHVDYLP